MIRYEDCDCDITTPTNPKAKHIKCKIIELMDDQMAKTGKFIDEMKSEQKSSFSKYLSPCILYCLGLLLLLVTSLLIGAIVGAALCGKEVSSTNGYGVF